MKIPLFLAALLVVLCYYGGVELSEEPSFHYILDHPGEFEGKEVIVRGVVEGKVGQLYVMDNYGREFRAHIPAKYLDDPQKGDIIDIEGTSRLEEGYLLAKEALHREEWRHHWLFYRSLIGLAVLGATVYYYRERLRGVLFLA